MVSVRPLPEFSLWLDSLKDEAVRGAIAARIKRLGQGLLGDAAPVGEGVSELRIHLVLVGASISCRGERN
jgi:putative addiction module killer protein